VFLIKHSPFKYVGQFKNNFCNVYIVYLKELKETFHVYPCIIQLVQVDMVSNK